jgi:hypothetical protein
MDEGDREMTTCEMMDRVERSPSDRRPGQVAAAGLAINDLRALLHL